MKKSLKHQKIERRRSPRQRLKTMVSVTGKEKAVSGETDNYSLTGLFFRCNFIDDFSLDDPVDLSFTDGKGDRLEKSGRVVRKSGDGIAVHYQSKPGA